ncbi:MAG: hypothetical protein AB8F94_12030 [Saprospiraceae bacterium]
MKIIIALDSLEIPAWKFTLLEKIQLSSSAEIGLFYILKKSKPTLSKNSLCQKHRRLDAKLFKPSPDAFSKKNIQSAFPNIKILESNSSDDSINTDIIIWLSEHIPPTHLYSKSRLGIWFYTFGSPGFETTCDELIGHSAFFQKQETATAALHIKQSEDDSAKTVYQSWSMPHAYSLTLSQNEQAWKISSFVPRVLEELSRIGEVDFFKKINSQGRHSSFDFSNKNNTPTFFQCLINFFLHFSFLVKRKLDNLRFTRQWILLFRLGKSPSREFSEFKKLLPPKDKFWADPFLWNHEGQHFVFLEELPFSTEKGYISVLKILKDGEITPPQKVLELPYHLSYPFLFEFEKKLYMIPESFSARNIQLFECTQFPDQWQHKMDLMTNIVAADSTLLFHQNKWWMFTNMVENEGGSLDDELYLFYADSPLTSEWTPHPQNPIVSDVRRARPAGNLFFENGKLIRPSQDCSKVYGFGFNFNEIEILSETEYREKHLTNVRPDWDKNLHRVHSFNHQNELTIIDGMIRG